MKQLFIGLIAFLLLPVALVQAGDNTPDVLTAPGGRFVFGQVSEWTRDKFMLDTQTGRLWEIKLLPDSSYMLEAVPYIWIDSTTGTYKVINSPTPPILPTVSKKPN